MTAVERIQTRDDGQLMAATKSNDVGAFGELYDRYCDRAYGVALSVCSDEGRAQDAVQEAFLAIWTCRASFSADKGSLAAWLLTVVRHRAIDLARGNGRHARRRAGCDQLEDCAAADDVCEQTLERDSADRMRASLELLPEAQREVIALAFFDQLSHTEIAERLDLPSGTVKGRMRLGLQKLRRTWNDPSDAQPAANPTEDRKDKCSQSR